MINITAVGDGITDDTAAFQSALDAGGHVYAPGGAYRIAETPLRIKERTWLQLAPDAVIVRDSGPGLIRNRWPDDDFGGYGGRGAILIEGGMWDMRGGTVAGPASAMTFAHAHGITVRDTVIQDVPGAHGIDLIGCRYVRIGNVTFAGYLADPADAQPRESIQVDGSYGSYSGDCAPYDKTPCRDVIVSQCRFGGSPTLPAPQRAVGSHGFLADVQGFEHGHIKVINCVMDDVTDAGVVAWCWQESIISGNTIWSPGKNGIAVKERGWHLDVSHNSVFDAGTSGLDVNGPAAALNNLSLHGNIVIGSSRAANNTHHGICVQGGAKRVSVTCNKVGMRGSGNNSRNGLYVSASCSQIQRFGNDLRASGVTASLSDSSASPVTSAADTV